MKNFLRNLLHNLKLTGFMFLIIGGILLALALIIGAITLICWLIWKLQILGVLLSLVVIFVAVAIATLIKGEW